jgi:hypothetical protein
MPPRRSRACVPLTPRFRRRPSCPWACGWTAPPVRTCVGRCGRTARWSARSAREAPFISFPQSTWPGGPEPSASCPRRPASRRTCGWVTSRSTPSWPRSVLPWPKPTGPSTSSTRRWQTHVANGRWPGSCPRSRRCGHVGGRSCRRRQLAARCASGRTGGARSPTPVHAAGFAASRRHRRTRPCRRSFTPTWPPSGPHRRRTSPAGWPCRPPGRRHSSIRWPT